MRCIESKRLSYRGTATKKVDSGCFVCKNNRMYNRMLSGSLRGSRKSILLLGPRQVGKSTLIRSLKPELEINLAVEAEYFHFQAEVSELEQRLAATGVKTVFIDEIQRIPRLLNSIQALIDRDKKLKFYLTGSSARKLKRGKANLIPGRVFSYALAPLCLAEAGRDWDEKLALQFGSLPEVTSLSSVADKKKILQSYTNAYLKEEILSEALVRQVDGFVRFLTQAGAQAGRYLDYSKLAARAKVPRQSVVRHFEILEDTMIAHRVENDPDLDPDQVDLVKHPRFYFFDLGVLNALRGTFDLGSDRIGALFEHLVFNQLFNSATAHAVDFRIHNFRTRGGLEVDFILALEGRKVAIECKASDHVSDVEIAPLRALSTYYKKMEKMVIYRGLRERKNQDVWILPLPRALQVMGLL